MNQQIVCLKKVPYDAKFNSLVFSDNNLCLYSPEIRKDKRKKEKNQSLLNCCTVLCSKGAASEKSLLGFYVLSQEVLEKK